MTKTRTLLLVAVAAILVLGPLIGGSGLGRASAETSDDIGPPTPGPIPVGTFGGIDYVQYDGVFEGETSTGAFRVPYRITAPANAAESNRTLVVEPSHFAIGLGALNRYLGSEFLLSRGFVHAGIGWSDVANRILDPTVAGAFVQGGSRQYGGHTDHEIISDFAQALVSDGDAIAMVGTTERRYITGFSDSSDPVLGLVTSGLANDVFDFAIPFTAEKHDPQAALALGRFNGKVTVVNSEAERPKRLLDSGVAPGQYRFYAVPGTPHVPDHLDSAAAPPTSPASFAPELRARFLQGHAWVLTETSPPPSTHLLSAPGTALDRDANGNAIAVDTDGALVPRLPFIEVGEARFISGFRGSYDTVRSMQELGFDSHADYLTAFSDRLTDHVAGGFILAEDAEDMRARAALCPPLTFTETYRDHYQRFVDIEACN